MSETGVPRKRALAGWAPIGVAVLGVLVAAFLVLRPASGSPGLVGKPAPDFTLPRADGGTLRLSSLRGHPVLINFWGVSCPPCRRESPLLQRAYLRDRARGLVVIGLDAQGDDGQAVAAFAAERGLTYPMLADSSGIGAARYGVKDLPYSILVDRQGIVRDANPSPFLDAGPLDQALRAIL